MWSNQNPTMMPWSKQLCNGLNNVECMSRPRPCTLWNAHSLQAIQVRPRVHKRQSRATRHVRRMWCNTAANMWPWTKLTFLCQAQNHGRRMCQRQAMNTTQHSHAECTCKMCHWSTVDNQEQRNMSAICGPEKQQTCGHGASKY